jgi:hypothetical protein
MRAETRQLKDLEGVGKECLRDFAALSVRSVRELSRRNPETLFHELCFLTGKRQDICVLDVLRCAVAQARNPALPKAQRKWWHWSQKRLNSGLR